MTTRPQAEPPRPGDDYAIPPRPTEVVAARAAHAAIRREIVEAGGGSVVAGLLAAETEADDPAESQRAIDHGGAVAVPEAGAGCESGDCRCQSEAAPAPPVAFLVDRVDLALRLRAPALDLQDHAEAVVRLSNDLIRRDRHAVFAPMDGGEIDRVLEYRIGEARAALETLERLREEVRGRA